MRRLVVHPILLAIYPVLSLFVFNTDALPLQEAFQPVALVLIAALVIWFVISRLVAASAKGLVLTSVFLILFFAFGHAIDTFRSFLYSIGQLRAAGQLSESTGGLLVWAALWLLLFGITCFLVVKTTSDLEVASQFLNYFSIFLILILVVDGVMRYNNDRAAFAFSSEWKSGVNASLEYSASPSPAKSARPSIYYVILDAYGRGDILKDLFSFDNSAFYSYLAQKGFYVADKSTSNYPQTALSLASSLNSVYLDDVVSKVGGSSTNRSPLATMITNSKLSAELHLLGYKSVAFSTGSPSTEIKQADVYKKPPVELSAFDNTFLHTTPIPLLLKLPILPDQYDLHRGRILYTFDQLASQEPSDAPEFVFAHIIAPHPPFVFKADGTAVDPDMRFDYLDGSSLTAIIGEKAYAEAYRQQLAFVTTKTKQMIDALLSRPNPPIIIIQGDHGPASTLDWMNVDNTDLSERMSILNAYYFPDHDYHDLYPSITPVNSFKVVLNHFFDANLKLSQDRNYFSALQRPYLLTDVTDKLKEKK